VKFPVTAGQVKPTTAASLRTSRIASAVDKDKLNRRPETRSLRPTIRNRGAGSPTPSSRQPAMVRTMAVKPRAGPASPPSSSIGENGCVDLQPLRTHARQAHGEIGKVSSQIEKKGKQNRRIRGSFR